jgi:NTE family protein
MTATTGRSVVGSRALVLGGGGVTGIAWELGVLDGLREAGVDLTAADLVIGTSAGSAVAAQITSGAALADLYAREAGARTGAPSKEKAVTLDLERFAQSIAAVAAGVTSAVELRARIGRLAVDADTVPEAERLAIIASRLPSTEWPERPLLITGVDTETGELVVWSRESGVPLVSAVAASCAVPIVWPPVTIGGRRYMDGGVRSGANADLAAGADAVVVLAPMGEAPAFPGTGLRAELTELGDAVRTAVIQPDEAALAAIGPNVLDPSRRAAAARAGRDQAKQAAAQVRDTWG